MNSLFIGRWQPLHDGHKKLFADVLNKGEAHTITIGIRDTAMSKANPYTVAERIEMIKAAYPDLYGTRVFTTVIPDIDEVCYGRGVGYGIREIELDDLAQTTSATKIREAKVWWLSGNSGCGKTTLSARINDAIHLDGDRLRAIWPGLGFSEEDRAEQNLRAARLANELRNQGYDVVVSVICPYKAVREQVRILCPGVKFVYIEGGQEPSERYPYEMPDSLWE